MFSDEKLKYLNGEALPIHCLIDGQDENSNKAGYKPKVRNELHYHSYIELIYVSEGNVKIVIEDKNFYVEKDDFFIIFAGEPHGFYRADEKSYQYIVLKFLPDILYNKTCTSKELEYYISIKNNTHDRIIKNNSELKEYMSKAITYFNSTEYGSEYSLRSNIFAICAILLSFWNKNDSGILKSETLTSVQLTIFKLMLKLEKSSINMNAKEAAKFCNLSQGYFSKVFKAVAGMTFHEYTRKLKIKEAQRLLACTDNNITDIAYSLGYCSSSFFTKDFKTVNGITPLQYRKKTSKL